MKYSRKLGQLVEPEADTFSFYLDDYRQHLSESQAHSIGHDGSPLPPSFFLPTGHWTAQDKDLFFHALTRYSRFRPDLIAECIPSKTVVDVCTYLRLLEDGSAKNIDAFSPRRNLDPAMEVSLDWIDVEECCAVTVLSEELQWDTTALQKKRHEELQARSDDLIPEGLSGDELAQKQREFDDFKRTKEAEWAQEAVLASLDKRHRQVINGFFLQSKTDDGEDSGSREPSQSNDDERPDDNDGNQPSGSSATPPPPSSAAPSAPPSPKADQTTIEQLSPKSRRLHQKRLYMRRKRAELNGKEVNAEPVALVRGRKPKGGQTKKQKGKVVKKRRLDEDFEARDGEMDELSDESDNESAERRGGRVLHRNNHEKIRNILAEHSIDRKFFEDEGLDLIRISSLGHMIEFNGMSNNTRDLATCISTDTIRYITFLVRHFTTRVAQQAIILREQERKLKQAKVWRTTSKEGQVLPSHVHQALACLDVPQVVEEGSDNIREDEDENEGDEEEEEEDIQDEFNILDDMNPDFILPPSDWQVPPLADWTLNDRTFSEPAEEEEEDLFPRKNDLLKLDEEISEEFELDAQDKALSAAYEKKLWERYFHQRPFNDPNL